MASNQSRNFLSRRKFASAFTGVVLAGCSGGGGSEGDGGDGGGGGETDTATTTDTATPTETATETPTATATEASQPADTTIDVGPNGNLVFNPEATRVSTGDVVEWVAQSGAHNVACNPDHNSQCTLPDGAETFASYEGDNVGEVMSVGDTFRHEFTVPGEYVYVCIPHASAGMVGRIVVR